jgi:hypothetical protein
MTNLSPESAKILDAGEYRRAHRGKLMTINREEGRKLSSDDFFYFDDVGTHPTGLMVTGLFSDKTRRHMQETIVRDTTQAEIAQHQSLTTKLSRVGSA